MLDSEWEPWETPELVEYLSGAGVHLYPRDGQLHSTPPRGSIPPAMAAIIVEHKVGILAYLTQVEARLEVFLAQASRPTSLDFLHVPWAPVIPGRCLSCGDEPVPGSTRCHACKRAARIVRRERGGRVDTIEGATMRRHGVGRIRAQRKILPDIHRVRSTPAREAAVEAALAQIRAEGAMSHAVR